MRLADFHYDLPADRIALRPPRERDGARLVVVDRDRGERHWTWMRHLPEFLDAGDLAVVNDTRVVPARLLGNRDSGARVEALVLGPFEGERLESWALVTKSGRLRQGEMLRFDGGIRAEVMEKGERGRVRLRFVEPDAASVRELLDRHGRMPLPPYIARDPDDEDRLRYQTIFARDAAHAESVAAPTAGLHLSGGLMTALGQRGIGFERLTLQVGPGTFAPVEHEDVERHVMAAERYEISERAATRINAHRARGCRVLAVGTTTTRALESAADDAGQVPARTAETALFLRPGARFRVVDRLLTNFHLPRSTLLMLVCAFWERQAVLETYREALARGFSFYSYGDAMLLR